MRSLNLKGAFFGGTGACFTNASRAGIRCRCAYCSRATADYSSRPQLSLAALHVRRVLAGLQQVSRRQTVGDVHGMGATRCDDGLKRSWISAGRFMLAGRLLVISQQSGRSVHLFSSCKDRSLWRRILAASLSSVFVHRPDVGRQWDRSYILFRAA